MFLKVLEDFSGSFVMEGEIILGVDAHVVHIDLKPFLSNHVCVYMVHEHLECRGCIGESKEHVSWFV